MAIRHAGLTALLDVQCPACLRPIRLRVTDVVSGPDGVHVEDGQARTAVDLHLRWGCDHVERYETR